MSGRTTVPATSVDAPGFRPMLEEVRLALASRRPDLNGPLVETEQPLDILVVGVYVPASVTSVEHCVRTLASDRHRVSQRWLALGGDPPSAEVAAVTVDVIPERVPKFELINRLVEVDDVAQYDLLVVSDDDILLPEDFLDRYAGYQELLDFALAQPARTRDSYVDHFITERHPDAHARLTRFVEIGPVFSLDRRAMELMLPFDLRSPMGWGYEEVWSRLLEDHGLRMGIVDATPVSHSLREPVSSYSIEEAKAERAALLAQMPHRPLMECKQQALELYRLEETED